MSAGTEEIENDRRWQILRVRIAEENIKKAFRVFRESGIEPVLIKGWAAAIEYPEKHRRPFGDMDLCVAPESFEKALEVLSREEVRNLNIDLHCGLRHLDTVSWEVLFQNSRVELIDDLPVRILSREDHLRVLCVHWLTDGGAYREKLLDIHYLLENDKAVFDWERCFAPIEERRREWIIKTVAIVHQYHPLDVSKIPFADQLESIPGWLTKALEREWASDRKLQPILSTLTDRAEFWKQIKKRFPPNAIGATIDMNGRFDDSTRFFYQIGSIFVRFKPSVERAYRFFIENLRKIFKGGK